MRILLGITGSIAVVKLEELYERLSSIGDVKIVATPSAINMLQKATNLNILTDEDEKSWEWNKILHIELRDWAQIMVIAPCTMNTLAKIANGLCDNLLTEIVRAWDNSKPIFIAPAANTKMYENKMTSIQLKNVQEYYNCSIVKPIIGKLACGDIGIGKMANVSTIISTIVEKTKWFKPILNIPYVPIDNHPGSFGYKRSYYYHPGVDLYTRDSEPVFACEDGEVLHIGQFTGPPDHQHWEETYGVVIKGIHIINYGEIYKPNTIMVGSYVKRGEIIGHVKRVIPEGKERPDILGHSTSMLHFELYDAWTGEFADWKDEKPGNLLDPTELLLKMYTKD